MEQYQLSGPHICTECGRIIKDNFRVQIEGEVVSHEDGITKHCGPVVPINYLAVRRLGAVRDDIIGIAKGLNIESRQLLEMLRWQIAREGE